VLSWVFAFAAFHHTHLHPFQFSDFTVGAKIHGLTVPQVINLKRILYGVRTDYLFPRMAPKTLRICRRLGDNGGGAPVKKRSYPASAYLSLPQLTSLFILRLIPHHVAGTRRNTSILHRRGYLPRSRQTRSCAATLFRHRTSVPRLGCCSLSLAGSRSSECFVGAA
jgi:hypothetical protein